MAKPDKPLLSLGAKGTIAGSLTFQKRGQLTIARKKPIPTDPKSPAQLAQRHLYKDAVDAWHALSPEEQEAWRGVCPGLTAYQCFIRSELKYVPPPIPIDIGPGAIFPFSYFFPNQTIIDKDNPANAPGILDTVEIWAYTTLSGCLVGTFYLTNGATLKCRDSVFIGTVSLGEKKTFTGLTIAVETADYIGIYFTSGYIALNTVNAVGIFYQGGQHIDPGDEMNYVYDAGYTISIYGTGEGPA